MTRTHLLTFIWLRWRLLVNQVRRAGTASLVVTTVLSVLGVAASVALFAGGLALGALGMAHLPDYAWLFIWAGAIALFLFFWLIGLMTALQRSETLSIDKVLHLPVSPAGAFVINYLSSLVSLSLILFGPGMTGLAIGQVYSLGPMMLLGFPLLAAFIFAMTALTYQFQGWIASLVANPRRRRTIVVLVTFGFILLVQLPNLLNFMRPWQPQPQPFLPTKEQQEKQQKFVQEYQSGRLTVKEFKRRNEQLQEEFLKQKTAEQDQAMNRAGSVVRLVCGILPPGWVAVGMEDLADGRVSVALLGTFGLGLIGTWSMRRAYRTTILMCTQGGFAADRGPAPPKAVSAEPSPHRPRFLEWRIPWVPENAAAVALAGFRSLMRAPEAKMLLLTPIIMVVVFGAGSKTFLKAGPAGPLVALGIIWVFLISMTQFASNVFGFDRDGFRTFVLSPVPRREILRGKNLAFAPVVVGLGLVLITAAGVVLHLRWDHFLMVYLQLVTMYLCFCLLGNASSIFAPYLIPAGSMKRARPSFTVMLISLLGSALSTVMVGLPGIFPLGVELIVDEGGGVKGVPIALAISLVELPASLWAYGRILSWEGRWLAQREQQILEVVSKKAE